MSSPSTPTASIAAPPRRRRQLATTVSFWILVGPLALGLAVFTVLPIVWGFVISLHAAQGTIDGTKWVGFDNYAAMLSDSGFLDSLKTVIIFAVLIVPTTFFLGLGLALLVNSARWGSAFFRSAFFLPTACSYVVASLIWKMSLFNGLHSGIVNTGIGFFGIDPIAWTFTPPYYWYPLVSVRLWLQLGFVMLIFLAGLQEIPRHIYEAAYVDGAKPGWTMFRHITFPLLRNTSLFILFIQMIAAFQAFDEFYNIVGMSQDQARPPLVYIYSVALSVSQDYGRGAAGAFIVAALILLATLVQIRVFGLGRSDD